MRLRLWPLVGFSFAALLGLVGLFAWSVARKSLQIDRRAAEAHTRYQRADDAVTNVRANVYRAALLSREALPPGEERSLEGQLIQIRRAAEAELQRLSGLLGPAQRPSLNALRSELSRYWESLPMAASEAGSGVRAASARNERRTIVLRLAEQIDALNEASIRQQEAEILEDREALQRFASRALALLLILSAAIAAGSIRYLARLERRWEEEKTRAEDAEHELRRLSQQLVRAQEEERKTISRELHDEVGQLLTGLRLELGALAKNDETAERVNSLKSLAEDALRAVRNLSLLLRPSMLDDLGLEPALKWQAKEFSRRLGIPITVDIEGSLETLPETHRICLYRVVQEALTNSARHAAASRITIAIKQEPDRVRVAVRDNGKGFPGRELRTQGAGLTGTGLTGMGLTGMEERIRMLQGTLTVASQPGKGTEVEIALPVYGAPAAVAGVKTG